MSPNTTIRVDPQELRDTAAQLRHSSADIQHINVELRHAVMELDTGCWPSGDAARLNAHFSEAEIAGRRRVQARDDLSDTLMRAADAFERADTTAVQQLMGLPPDWIKMILGGGQVQRLFPFPITTMYVTSYIGLNLRRTPEIPANSHENLVMDSRIPDNARIYVHINVPTQVANNFEWRYITYIDAEGKAHSGWVASKFLRPATQDMVPLPETETAPEVPTANVVPLSRNEQTVSDLREQINESADRYGVNPTLVAAILYDELQRRGVDDQFQDVVAQSIIDAEGTHERRAIRTLEIVVGLNPFDDRSLTPEPIENQSFGLPQMNVGTVYDLVDWGYIDAPEGWADDRLDCSLTMLLDNDMAPLLIAAYVKQITDYNWQEHGQYLGNTPASLGTLYNEGLNSDSEPSDRGQEIADNMARMEEVLNYSPPLEPVAVPKPEPEPEPTLTPTPTPSPTAPPALTFPTSTPTPLP